MSAREQRRRRDAPGAGPLSDRVAALMRAGGWRQVTVTAAMGHLGTDVVGTAADGLRWLLRCHPDPARLTSADVYRFAETARRWRRGDRTMIVLDGAAPEDLLHAAAGAGVTLVDAESLSWWAALQSPTGRRPPR